MHFIWRKPGSECTFRKSSLMENQVRHKQGQVPPRQTSCRLLTIPLKAALENARGSIRTTIQRESGGTIAGAGEWCAGGRGA